MSPMGFVIAFHASQVGHCQSLQPGISKGIDQKKKKKERKKKTQEQPIPPSFAKGLGSGWPHNRKPFLAIAVLPQPYAKGKATKSNKVDL